MDRDGTFESFVILAAHLFSCFPNLCNYGSTLSSAQQLRGSPFVRRRFLDDLAVKTCVFFFCYRGTNQPRDGVRGPFGFHLQQAAFIFHLLLLNQLRFSQSSRGPSFLLNTCDSLSTSLCTSGSPIPSPWAFPFLSV